MKKKKWLISVSIIGGILIVLGTALGIFFAKGYRVSTGVYMKLTGGLSVLVCDDSGIINSEIRMTNKTDHKLFSDLTIGDRILVIHDGIERSESLVRLGEAGTYAVFKLQDGTIEDVPQVLVDRYKHGRLELEPPSKTAAEETFNVAQYRTRYNDDTLNALYAKAINHQNVSFGDPIPPGSFRYLPLFKLDTLAEFEQFKAEFGDPLGDPTYFPDVPVKYEEDFFAENTLMLVYVNAPSRAIRYSVNSVESENGKFCIHMKDLAEADKVYTDDLASWYFAAEIPDSMIENCTEFDADINYTE